MIRVPSLALLLALPVFGSDEPGERGAERGLALLTAKALSVPGKGQQAIDNAVLLVRGGRIESVGPRDELQVPEGYAVIDVGERWVAPGMIDLHSHVAGSPYANDLNDMVYLTNPGLRASAGVVPGNSIFDTAVAAGVTSVLYIPGSGTNIGGQGVLLKTGFEGYEQSELRNPGSLKLAQSGNPESWTLGVGKSFMNWNTANTFRRGLAYARAWGEFEQGAGPQPEKDPQWEIFRDLEQKRVQVSTHTQIYQVVLRTITMVKEQFGLDVYIDHGSFDGWRAATKAWEAGVPAILGPRQISTFMWVEYRRNMWVENDTDGAILGIAAQYQKLGHRMIGFNTDSPVIPQESLPLQAAMAVRYGFDTSNAEHVRGLTIVPAMAAGIAHRVGSLEPGKDADLIVVDGDPADPRTTVSMTFIDGERVYDNAREARRW
jgi:hypothetical protein